MILDASLVSQAIVVWTGWRRADFPTRDEMRLVEQFGPETTADLLPRIRELEDDFYASDARITVADINEMRDVAAGQFRTAHPEISEDAVQALAWCYKMDNIYG